MPESRHSILARNETGPLVAFHLHKGEFVLLVLCLSPAFGVACAFCFSLIIWRAVRCFDLFRSCFYLCGLALREHLELVLLSLLSHARHFC